MLELEAQELPQGADPVADGALGLTQRRGRAGVQSHPDLRGLSGEHLNLAHLCAESRVAHAQTIGAFRQGMACPAEGVRRQGRDEGVLGGQDLDGGVRDRLLRLAVLNDREELTCPRCRLQELRGRENGPGDGAEPGRPPPEGAPPPTLGPASSRLGAAPTIGLVLRASIGSSRSVDSIWMMISSAVARSLKNQGRLATTRMRDVRVVRRSSSISMVRSPAEATMVLPDSVASSSVTVMSMRFRVLSVAARSPSSEAAKVLW